VVQILDFRVTWQTVGVNAKFDFFNDYTENRIYVTYDKPYNNTRWNNTVTEKRLEWLCTLASGDSNGHDSVEKIHEKGGRFAVGAPIPKSHWEVAAGVRCECVDLSIFYMLASRMLGLKTGELVFLYPSPGKVTKESTSSTAREWRMITGDGHAGRHDVDRDHEELLLVDLGGGWNQYEACFKFAHPDKAGNMKTRYYAGGAEVHDTAHDVMKSVCKMTHWTYVTDYRDSGGKLGENICHNPGPSPVDVWNRVP
jgi:hypothetical protein